ncbi:cysteine--tRNA ligase [Candidatus Parcubacteria bacterium]|nr:cysteine--tRNA ligase [Candidatus Parcubacteria bacterium]
MALIYLHNTLSGKKEPFAPAKKGFFGFLRRPKVGMYHCGPTVYNYAHIGNLRAYVFADTLKRLVKAAGYSVKQVINITDVGHLTSDADTGEDKMEKARRREHKSAWDIAKFYTEAFFSNLADLNIDTAGTKFPRATDFIREQIRMVALLEKKGFAYRTSDGIYFDTAKFPDYGKLGDIDIAGIREGERIGKNAEKRNPTDFALWKLSAAQGGGSAGEKRDMEWDSPWGVGFPGWHIECSAMASALLGIPVDVHTGGIDHIPVHHNNEIAQSEAAFGKEFVRYWLHSAFVNIEGGKMAKSEGNFITLDTLKERGFSPLAYRYFLLGARYSTPLNFTWEALEAAQTAYKRLKQTIAQGEYFPKGTSMAKEIPLDYSKKLLDLISDDLNTPAALALLHDLLEDEELKWSEKKKLLREFDSLLGLDLLSKGKEREIPVEVQKLADERARARAAKDWKRSDELRDEIAKLGFEVKDTPEGQKIS